MEGYAIPLGSPSEGVKQKTNKPYALAVVQNVSPLKATAFAWPSLEEFGVLESASEDRSLRINPH